MIFNKKFIIMAGPCSLDYENINDIYAISQIEVINRKGKKQKAVFGTRVVGLKSRTAYQEQGKGMGIDFAVYQENLKRLMTGRTDLEVYPSVKIAKEIIEKTHLLVATEIMDPYLQLSVFERYLPKEKLMAWNPAVNQLGWPVKTMAEYCRRNKWFLGLKNPKWYGDELLGQTTMEKTWIGLAHYTKMIEPGYDNYLFLIHRGVDIYSKGDYRNLPVHQAARRVKISVGGRLLFDPSHIHGPKLRDSIVKATIEAAKMMIDEENYLYDGILIEVGRSKTDTEQHITVSELDSLCQQIAEFRELVPPV